MLNSVFELFAKHFIYLNFITAEKDLVQIKMNVAIVVMYTLSTAHILECSWLYSRHQWFDGTC